LLENSKLTGLLYRGATNVPVRAVHGFAQCTRNTIFAIPKMRLYNAT
jgi:hypothetical protein